MPEEPPGGAQPRPDHADLTEAAPADGPVPAGAPAEPGPIAPPADPGPIAPPADPGPIAPPADPGPIAPPADPWQRPGAPAPPPAPGPPGAGMPITEAPTAGLPTADAPTAGMPTAGAPTAGLPATGGPIAGAPTEPYPWQVAPAPSARPRRRNRMVFLTSGLLLALLALVAVPLVVNGGDGGSSSGGGANSSPTADPAVSPEQYQGALTSTDTALAAGWRKLTTARTPATVRNAADSLALTAQSEAEKLADMTPPDQVTAAHAELVDALEALSAGLSSGSTENVCAGSSAVPRLSREASFTQVRAAAQALGTADPAHSYRVGTWVPKVAKDPKRRLGNGKYIKRSMSSGAGQLKIKNGGAADGVVSIVAGKGKQPAVVVYVRGKQSFTVRGIRDGTYTIYLSTGTDWDGKAKTFSRDCVFERFDDTFKFRSTSTTYTVWEITVQAVSGGNATAASVSPDDFPIG